MTGIQIDASLLLDAREAQKKIQAIAAKKIEFDFIPVVKSIPKLQYEMPDPIGIGSKIGDAIAKQLSSVKLKAGNDGIFGAIAGAVRGLVNLTIKSVFVGAFEGVGRELSSSLSSGLASGIEKTLKPIFGSFQLSGSMLGEAITLPVKKTLDRYIAIFGQSWLGKAIAQEFKVEVDRFVRERLIEVRSSEAISRKAANQKAEIAQKEIAERGKQEIATRPLAESQLLSIQSKLQQATAPEKINEIKGLQGAITSLEQKSEKLAKEIAEINTLPEAIETQQQRLAEVQKRIKNVLADEAASSAASRVGQLLDKQKELSAEIEKLESFKIAPPDQKRATEISVAIDLINAQIAENRRLFALAESVGDTDYVNQLEEEKWVLKENLDQLQEENALFQDLPGVIEKRQKMLESVRTQLESTIAEEEVASPAFLELRKLEEREKNIQAELQRLESLQVIPVSAQRSQEIAAQVANLEEQITENRRLLDLAASVGDSVYVSELTNKEQDLKEELEKIKSLPQPKISDEENRNLFGKIENLKTQIAQNRKVFDSAIKDKNVELAEETAKIDKELRKQLEPLQEIFSRTAEGKQTELYKTTAQLNVANKKLEARLTEIERYKSAVASLSAKITLPAFVRELEILGIDVKSLKQAMVSYQKALQNIDSIAKAEKTVSFVSTQILEREKSLEEIKASFQDLGNSKEKVKESIVEQIKEFVAEPSFKSIKSAIAQQKARLENLAERVVTSSGSQAIQAEIKDQIQQLKALEVESNEPQVKEAVAATLKAITKSPTLKKIRELRSSLVEVTSVALTSTRTVGMRQIEQVVEGLIESSEAKQQVLKEVKLLADENQKTEEQLRLEIIEELKAIIQDPSFEKEEKNALFQKAKKLHATLKGIKPSSGITQSQAEGILTPYTQSVKAKAVIVEQIGKLSTLEKTIDVTAQEGILARIKEIKQSDAYKEISVAIDIERQRIANIGKGQTEAAAVEAIKANIAALESSPAMQRFKALQQSLKTVLKTGIKESTNLLKTDIEGIAKTYASISEVKLKIIASITELVGQGASKEEIAVQQARLKQFQSLLSESVDKAMGRTGASKGEVLSVFKRYTAEIKALAELQDLKSQGEQKLTALQTQGTPDSERNKLILSQYFLLFKNLGIEEGEAQKLLIAIDKQQQKNYELAVSSIATKLKVRRKTLILTLAELETDLNEIESRMDLAGIEKGDFSNQTSAQINAQRLAIVKAIKLFEDMVRSLPTERAIGGKNQKELIEGSEITREQNLAVLKQLQASGVKSGEITELTAKEKSLINKYLKEISSVDGQVSEAFKIISQKVQELSGVELSKLPRLIVGKMKQEGAAGISTDNFVFISEEIAGQLVDQAGEINTVLVETITHELRHVIQHQIMGATREAKASLEKLQASGILLTKTEKEDEKLNKNISQSVLWAMKAAESSLKDSPLPQQVKNATVLASGKFAQATEEDAYVFASRYIDTVSEAIALAFDLQFKTQIEQAQKEVTSALAEVSKTNKNQAIVSIEQIKEQKGGAIAKTIEVATEVKKSLTKFNDAYGGTIIRVVDTITQGALAATNTVIGQVALPVARKTYGVAAGVEDAVLSLLPYGKTAKGIIQNTALPMAAFGAATHFIPGGGMVAGLLGDAGSALGSTLLPQLSGSVAPFVSQGLSHAPVIGGALSGVANWMLGSSNIASMGGAIGEVGTALLAGKTILNAAGQAGKAVLTPANTEAIKQLPSASRQLSEQTTKIITQYAKVVKDMQAAYSEIKGLKAGDVQKLLPSELERKKAFAETIVRTGQYVLQDFDKLAQSLPKEDKFGGIGQLKKQIVNYVNNALKQSQKLGVDPAKLKTIDVEFIEVGKDVGRGLTTGLKQSASEARKVVVEIVEPLEKVARKELESQSPSRKFIRVGRDIVGGLITGIKGGAKTVGDVLKETVGQEKIVAESTNKLKETLQNIAVEGQDVYGKRRTKRAFERLRKRGDIAIEPESELQGESTSAEGFFASIFLEGKAIFDQFNAERKKYFHRIKDLESNIKIGGELTQKELNPVIAAVSELEMLRAKLTAKINLGRIAAQELSDRGDSSEQKKVVRQQIDTLLKEADSAVGDRKSEIAQQVAQLTAKLHEAELGDKESHALAARQKIDALIKESAKASKQRRQEITQEITQLSKVVDLDNQRVVALEKQINEMRLAEELLSRLEQTERKIGEGVQGNNRLGINRAIADIQSFKKDLGETSAKINTSQFGIDKTAKSFADFFKAQSQNVKQLYQQIGGIKGLLKTAAGAIAGFVAFQFFDPSQFVFAIQSTVQAAAAFEALDTAIANTSKNSRDAASNLKFVSEAALRTKNDITTVKQGFIQLQAAALGNEKLEGLVRPTTEALLQAGRSYNLSAEQLNRANTAIAQSFSKGQVMAEELKGQLSEALPSAIQVASRAFGVTTTELNQLVEKGVTAEQFFGRFSRQLKAETAVSSRLAADTIGASLTDLSNNFKLFQYNLTQAFKPVIAPVVAAMSAALYGLGQNAWAAQAVIKIISSLIIGALLPGLKVLGSVALKVFAAITGGAWQAQGAMKALAATVSKTLITMLAVAAIVDVYGSIANAGKNAAIATDELNKSLQELERIRSEINNKPLDIADDIKANRQAFEDSQPVTTKILNGVSNLFVGYNKLNLIEAIRSKEIAAQTDLIGANNKVLLEAQVLLERAAKGEKISAQEIEAATEAVIKSQVSTKSMSFQRENDKKMANEQLNAIDKLLPKLQEEADRANGIAVNYGRLVIAREKALKRITQAELNAINEVDQLLIQGTVTAEAAEKQKLNAALTRIQRTLAEERKFKDALPKTGNEQTNPKLREEIKKSQEEITKLVNEEAQKRIEIRKAEQAEAIAAVDKAQTRATEAIIANETLRKIEVQQLINDGVIDAQTAEQEKIAVTQERIHAELTAEEELRDRLRSADIPQLTKEEKIRASQQKTNELTLSLLESEKQAETAVIDAIEAKRARVFESRTKALDLTNQAIDQYIKQLDAIESATKRIETLNQAQADLVKATLSASVARGDLEIERLNRAKELTAKLNSDDFKSAQEKLLIIRQLNELGFNGKAKEYQISLLIEQAEKRRAQFKLQSLQQEQAIARTNLEIELRSSQLEAKKALIESGKQYIEGQKAILESQKQLSEAQANFRKESTTENAAAVATASVGLELSQQSLSLSSQAMILAQQQLNDQNGLADAKRRQLEIEQAIATEQLNQSEQLAKYNEANSRATLETQRQSKLLEEQKEVLRDKTETTKKGYQPYANNPNYDSKTGQLKIVPVGGGTPIPVDLSSEGVEGVKAVSVWEQLFSNTSEGQQFIKGNASAPVLTAPRPVTPVAISQKTPAENTLDKLTGLVNSIYQKIENLQPKTVNVNSSLTGTGATANDMKKFEKRILRGVGEALDAVAAF